MTADGHGMTRRVLASWSPAAPATSADSPSRRWPTHGVGPVVSLDVREPRDPASRGHLPHRRHPHRRRCRSGCGSTTSSAVVHLRRHRQPAAGHDGRRPCTTSRSAAPSTCWMPASRPGSEHVTVTSSGAAYGYHLANRGRLADRGRPRPGQRRVRLLAAQGRGRAAAGPLPASAPGSGQLVLRPGTILGDATANQITDLFEKPVVLGLRTPTSRSCSSGTATSPRSSPGASSTASPACSTSPATAS